MRLRFKKGLSLIEVVCASIIFLIAVTGFLTAMVTIRQPVESSKRSVQAALCGKQKLEVVKAILDNDTSPPVDRSFTYCCPNLDCTTPGPDGAIYRASFNVTVDAKGGQSIAANVTWTDPK